MLSQLVEIKSIEEVELMRQGAALTLGIISRVRNQIRVGQSTQDLDNLINQYIHEAGSTPAFLNYTTKTSKSPFPSHACLCVDEEVFHAPGSPNKKIAKGNLVTIDLGLTYRGFYADCADTMLIGDSNPQKLRLIQTCAEAIHNALPFCVPGGSTKEVTKAIENTIRQAGFFPAIAYGGHGIGTTLHMAPYVSNSSTHMIDCELAENMVLCLEPAVLTAHCNLQIADDGWTVTAPPGVLSAHVERMVQIRPEGGLILQ